MVLTFDESVKLRTECMVNETDQQELEPLDDEFDTDRVEGSKTGFLSYVLTVVQWMWIAARWTSLKVLDLSLWLILSFTRNQRAVRPTIRATFSKAERAAIARSQRYRCMYCGVRLTSDNLQIDHMDPVSRGGSNDDENLQALCRRCNIRKGNHTDDEFRERYWDLVGGFKQPPPRTIPQNYFVELMRSTDAHEGVQEANRNRYLTPRQRVERALPIPLVAWPAAFLLIGAYWFESLAVQVALIGIVFGIAFAAGLWLRARHIGIFNE